MIGETKLLHLRISAGYRGYPDVLRSLELVVDEGEIVGLVDAGGTGKDMLPLAITRLLEMRGGLVRGYIGFRGRNLMELDERQMKGVRGREIATLEPASRSGLNPVMQVGVQMMEGWRMGCCGKGNEVRPDLPELLTLVGLPATQAFLNRYPAELTVDQILRVRIAMAIVHKPALLIVDEPTRGLDPIARMEILDLLAQLNQKRGMSLLCLSRDMVSMAPICQRIAVLMNGQVVEANTADEMLRHPQHAYTRTLLASAAKLAATLQAATLQKGARAVA